MHQVLVQISAQVIDIKSSASNYKAKNLCLSKLHTLFLGLLLRFQGSAVYNMDVSHFMLIHFEKASKPALFSSGGRS